MSPWLLAAIVLALCLVPAGVAVLRGDAVERLVGLELTSILVTFILVALAEAQGESQFLSVALALSLLAFGGGLVFVRFLERWL